jgi:hypothetical protein
LKQETYQFVVRIATILGELELYVRQKSRMQIEYREELWEKKDDSKIRAQIKFIKDFMIVGVQEKKFGAGVPSSLITSTN